MIQRERYLFLSPNDPRLMAYDLGVASYGKQDEWEEGELEARLDRLANELAPFYPSSYRDRRSMVGSYYLVARHHVEVEMQKTGIWDP